MRKAKKVYVITRVELVASEVKPKARHGVSDTFREYHTYLPLSHQVMSGRRSEEASNVHS